MITYEVHRTYFLFSENAAMHVINVRNTSVYTGIHVPVTYFSPFGQSSPLIQVKKIFLSYPGYWVRQATQASSHKIVFHC